MTIDNIMGYKPRWYAACNGVSTFSENGYNCDGASIPSFVEKRTRDENKNRILAHVNSLIGKQETISTKQISEDLKMIEDFVIEVLENEFGDLDSDNHEE